MTTSLASRTPPVTDARIAAADVLAGLLRRRELIDAALQARVRGGIARLHADLVDLLRLGTYQLLYMGAVPAYAAIAQTVELVKRRHGIGAGGLANAVLRRIDREREALGDPAAGAKDPVEVLSRTHSHPRWLVERWVAAFGADATARLLSLNNTEATVILRPWGVGADELLASLQRSDVDAKRDGLLGDSIRLPQGTALLELGAWRQGQCFVQDPAAALVASYAAFPAGAVVGDLCAAPGGKSLELARTAAFVLAADRSEGRMRRMAENVKRLDARNIGLVVMDATVPATQPLDGILLDVPCTGTGTFRRHPDARWRLRISDLAILAATQATLLRAAAERVRPGGLLVYSTCSIEAEENDAQVDAFLDAHPEWALEPPPAGGVPDSVIHDGRLRVLPQETGTDGAFAARLRRAA
jgi:16S rRNA (cytosine967-C5)-methyltransferase